MAEMFELRHPDPSKQAGRCSAANYHMMRESLLKAVGAAGEEGILFSELLEAVGDHLPEAWSGSVSWWVTTVKLDLEARGLVERVPGASPQVVRIVK